MSEISSIPETETSLLPKFPAAEQTPTSSIGKSILSLLIYLAAGYWLFRDVSTLLMITFVILLHEGGHFIAMRWVGYKDLGVFFLPLIGAYVSGNKRVITQRESAWVLLAGPLPGILLGLGVWYLLKIGYVPSIGPAGINLNSLAFLLIILNGSNLLPIFPFDGGQLLNRVFLDEEGIISNLFVILSALILGYLAIQFKMYPLLIFPIGLLFRLWRSHAAQRIEKRIEESQINTEVSYAELPDADYWQIRRILIEDDRSCRNWAGEHLNDYSPQEASIQQAVEGQLHRTLVQDLSVSAKCLIAALWILALFVPFWLWLR